ncbi:MAG: prepilin-type N-terminal cleavage/methylation domain-containing protein [Burkholderiaceae bacterium]
MRATARRPPSRGFTLVELLVALAVMAMLAVLSWRGVDGMVRARDLTAQRADEILALQAGLGQWAADLDALQAGAQVTAIDWDGRVLRLTRRNTADAGEGLVVVAWSQRDEGNGRQWLRWQSPAVRTRGEWQDAWQRAATWSQNAGEEERRRQVAIAPLEEWQIFYFRGDAWTNPLSSDAATAPPPSGIAVQAVPQAAVPDGVRLVLTLPPGQAITGRLVRDWVRPTVGGGKS